ncbi:hypothetical protein FACS1894167_14030 [Synergistales bacterium]|nr:hypothetical protein FACS1894167_14030 [Synergistales bacterium]
MLWQGRNNFEAEEALIKQPKRDFTVLRREPVRAFIKKSDLIKQGVSVYE